ncbi:MAG TPA: ATP-binding protein [Thermoanaerobaculia bacterium]|jgi:signal transduction histidine kinase
MLKRLLTRAAQVAITFAGFALLNSLAIAFQVETGVSILFPATGFGILCVMFFGPIAAIGIIAATMVTPWAPESPPHILFASGVISAFEALIPWLVFKTRRDLRSDLRDMKSLLVFLVAGTIVNTGFSAIAGNLLVIDHPEGLQLVWHEVFVWWLADFTAALLIAVPILAFSGALRRGGATEREPRTIVNTLQIVMAIILLGFAASFATRTYLLNRLENDRLDQQAMWWEAEQTLNKMHSNFLRAAFVDANDPNAPRTVDAARRLNEQYIGDLEVAFRAMPSLSKSFPAVANKTRGWFRSAEQAAAQHVATPQSEEAHRTGGEISALHETLDNGNALAWRSFAEKRGTLMLVADMVDGLVFAILVLASVTIIYRVSRPLQQIRGAIDGMRDGEPLDAARISSPYLEFRSIASAMEQTSRELRDREIALRLQTDRAVAASKHKSEFLAKMSHELRTPLNSIIGFSELLAEQETTIEPQRRLAFLDNVTSSARHLLHLINDLLDIAKVESGKMKMHFENVDLRLAIANTVASTTPLFHRKKQELEVALPAEPMMARADIGRVEQVLLNLLANANKFSAEGQKIQIRSEQEEGAWRIDVIDQGIGISADDQKRIFDEFEQVHPRGPASAGTGLGLALAKRFVEMHGGAIAVESVPGSGARFSIRLPRV